MSRKNLWTAGLISLIALILNFQLAFAHASVTVGDYEIEYGWINEPVIVGQLNAFVINISDTSTGSAQPVEDVAGLTATVSYSGQSKTLTLQALGKDTPGQFIAPILPTIPGQYTFTLGGKLGDIDVNVEVEPEEVETTDALQFSNVTATPENTELGMINWLVYVSLLLGLIALILSVMALRKSR